MAHDVFISHDPRDRTVAEAACAALERAGHLCAAGPEDDDDLGRVLVLILSAAGAESAVVMRHAERAAAAEVPAIVLRIEPVEPGARLARALGAAHALDALPPPLAPHLDYLTAIVGRILDGGDASLMRPLTRPPQPMPPRPASRAWLPILLAGAAGVAAIAAVAMWVAR